jgi:adenylosuccinate synthase
MRHTIVADLGFGDAGKGTVVDWLCERGARAVVRFNGGAQAAHNVVRPDRRWHTFSQFGSGSFHPGVRTHLSRFVVVDPLALVVEADHLAGLGVRDPLSRLTVDAATTLATPYHRAANQARELARGASRHGSCGMGVGESVAYRLAHPDTAPTAADCHHPDRLTTKLHHLTTHLRADLPPTAVGWFDRVVPPVADCVAAFVAFGRSVPIVGADQLRALLADGPVVFEGAQGVLLDEWYGFHPYTTWSTATFANAETLLAEAGAAGTATRLGVLRTFTTRHGPGPLPTEDPSLGLADPRNPTNPWQGTFRAGHFDAVAHRYALSAAGGADALALTHLDTAATHPALRLCTAYRTPTGHDLPDLATVRPGNLDRQERLTRWLATVRPRYTAPVTDWITTVERALALPVVLASTGPTSDDKFRPTRAHGLAA